MARRTRTESKKRRTVAGWRILATGVVTAALLLVGFTPVQAAGSGVLNVGIAPVDNVTGEPQAEAGTGLHGDRVAYRVTYSCSVAACDNTTIQLAASQPDPKGLAMQNIVPGARETLLKYETWTAPAAGGTIGGTDATGKLVSLGNLVPGSGGSFIVVYSWSATSSANVVVAGQFYPNGFSLENSATISSPTAVANVTQPATPVIWQNQVPSPAIAQNIANGSSVRPNTNYTYSIAMSAGTLIPSGSGRVAGTPRYQAAGGYSVVEKLPAEASYVSSTGSGVYSATDHTVTWNLGYDEAGNYVSPNTAAAPGWGAASFSGWSTNVAFGAYNRTVTVSFPSSSFPEADPQGCNFEKSVGFSANVDVTYLDTASTEKSAKADNNLVVACWDPFGRGQVTKGVQADDGVAGVNQINVPPVVTGMTCPSGGRDDWGRTCVPGAALAAFSANVRFWQVDTFNGGNVPGVATVTDDALDQPGMPVTQVVASNASNFAYSYRCASGEPVAATATAVTSVTLTPTQVANGCRFVSSTVTSGPIAPTNIRPTDTAVGTRFRVTYNFAVAAGTENGLRSNTASATMAYPTEPTLTTIDLGSKSQSVNLRPLPKVAVPVQISSSTVTPVVTGGGQAVPGKSVVFSAAGAFSGVPLDSSFVPQYVFIAPVGWQIQDGSAAFPAGANVPAGVQFAYRTVTVSGVARQVAVATWPAGTKFGASANLPTMTVTAQPTFAVASGTLSGYDVWIGDSSHTWTNTQATFSGAIQDAPDVDGDGVNTEWFARSAGSIRVSAADGMVVVKEICSPDPEQADGCKWLGDPATPVPVSTVASDIRYRVSIQNTGNTTLSGIVGYDVLPYIGDSGTSNATAGTPRGSQYELALAGVANVSSRLGLSYSTSKQPPRPGVYSGATTGSWATTVEGAASIRATLTGNLAPGEKVSFEYTAAITSPVVADAVACNSVAVASTQLQVLEPPAVCAATVEADLSVKTPNRLPLQQGRPGVVPFTVENFGGSQSAPGTVSIVVPAQLTVTDLDFGDWSCTSKDGSAPIAGGTTLDCSLAEGAIVLGTPRTLALPVTPVSSSDEVCVSAEVAGPLHDAVSTNNSTESCLTVAPAADALKITKNDGLAKATIGQQLTYTVTVSSGLVGEAFGPMTVEDNLPGAVEFVSASGGGALTGADENGAGGVVTWALPSLAAGSTANADGAVTAVDAGASAQFTVTVRVLQAAELSSILVNTAKAVAVDPADPQKPLTPSAGDIDPLDRTPGIRVTKTSPMSSYDAVGDTIDYGFTVANTGNVTLTGVAVTEGAFTGSGSLTDVVCPSTTLAPGAAIECTASYEVEQGDLDRGSISNTATASGTPPTGLTAPVSPPSTVLLAAAQTSSLTLVKSADPTSAAAAGAKVGYDFLVTNTGNVTVTDVEITETAFTGDAKGLSDIVCPAAADSLAPGASVTCEASYTLTQADADRGSVSNPATATADAPGALTDPVSEPSNVVVTVAAAAALTLEKSVSSTDADATGDKVGYDFLVTNTGNVTVTGIAITETAFTGTGAPVAIECPTTSLAPGAEVTCVGSYTLTQADVDAGGIDNTATAGGVTPGAAPVSSQPSTAELDIAPTPALTLVKSADPASASAAGAKIGYDFVVTNTGNVTVTDVEITETAFTGDADGLSDIVCPAPAASLAPGASVTCEASYTLTQDDADRGSVSNTATATGNAPGELAKPVSKPSTAVVTVAAAAALTLKKSVSSTGTDSAGDKVGYDFLVSNTGNVTVTGIAITETAFTGTGDEVAIECPTTSLAPGASVTCVGSYTLTQADVDAGGIDNTATAGGLAPGATPVSSPPSSVELDIAPTPALTLLKSADPSSAAAAGTKIGYDFVVTNTGNVTVKAVEITETAFDGDAKGLSDIVCPAAAASLAPGALIICEASYTLTQADADRGSVSNTATAKADAPGTATDPVSAPSTSVVTVAPAAALTLKKSISSTATDAAGDKVGYDFVVTNTGNVTVTSIAITETAFTGTGDAVAIECASTTLAPGASVTCTGTYTLTQADVDAGGVDNTAIASGVTPGAAPVSSASSSAELDIEPSPALTMVKSISTDQVVVGQQVTYSFVVTNTGNVTVSGVEIDETTFTGTGELSAIVCDENATALAPSSQAICSATYTITQDDVDAGTVNNTALAGGTSPAGPISSPPSSVELPFVKAPALTVVKTTDVASYGVLGQAIEYRFRVTNTGNVTMSGVQIAEDEFTGTGELGDITCSATSLLPGQFADCVASYTVTQPDLDAGELSNTAHASASAPLATVPTLSQGSTVKVLFEGDEGLLLQKKGTPVDSNADGIITAGDHIVWSFVVTNTGVTTLTDLQIDDPTAGEVSCDATVLDPGAVLDCAAPAYAITAADAKAGRVVNVASARANGSGGVEFTSAEATATVEVAPVPLPTPVTSPSAAPSAESLARTGSSPTSALLAAALVLLLGAAAAAFARRRRHTQPSGQ